LVCVFDNRCIFWWNDVCRLNWRGGLIGYLSLLTDSTAYIDFISLRDERLLLYYWSLIFLFDLSWLLRLFLIIFCFVSLLLLILLFFCFFLLLFFIGCNCLFGYWRRINHWFCCLFDTLRWVLRYCCLCLILLGVISIANIWWLAWNQIRLQQLFFRIIWACWWQLIDFLGRFSGLLIFNISRCSLRDNYSCIWSVIGSCCG